MTPIAPSLPVLTFHSVDDRPAIISFSPQLFERGVARLHQHGYRSLGLPEVVDSLRRGVPFPGRSLVITFDDGYESVYLRAFPVLQRFGMSATVFLTVGKREIASSAARLPSLDGRSMLSWHQIREMQEGGIDVGAHTLTHPDLTRLPVDQIEAEVCEAKSIIEDVLGIQVTSFAYPYGRYDGKVRRIVEQHFMCACSDKLGLVCQGSDTHALERVDTYYLRTERLFNLILTRSFPLYILLRSIPRRIRRGIQGGLGG